MKKVTTLLSTLALATTLAAQNLPQTERQYLSGHGCDDMVEWDFFCTNGRNSGKWTKIGVPSCWELQGFGTYQYGITFYGKPFPEGVADEKGMYKYEFEVPEKFRGKQVNLVFEASMTDTEVKVNGRKVGSKHQGAFYRFSYNITDFLKYGKKNLLEVTVAKESENASVNLAERRADYWNFGGIFRPVFLEVKPAVNLRHIAIDAKMDGTFRANCYTNISNDGMSIRTQILDKKGKLLWHQVENTDKPYLIVTSEKVTKEYLAYLDQQNISWIACGKEKIDLKKVCDILYQEFHIERMGIVGGPAINTSFLDGGLLDEISILVGAGIDGRKEFSSVFDGLENNHPLIYLKLLDVKRFKSDAIWLRYKV